MESKIEVKDDGVIVTRVFSAPLERVFKAWTDPALVSQWWGCAQTTHVESFVDLRIGGEYRHVMTIEGAGEFDARGTIVELDAPNMFAYEVEFGEIEGMPPMPKQNIRVEFKSLGDQTEVKLTHSGIVIDQIKGEVQKGWGAAFEKLNASLSDQSEAA